MVSVPLRHLMPLVRNSFFKSAPAYAFKNSIHTSRQDLHQEIVEDISKIERNVTDKVIGSVNELIKNNSHGRLFAVVQVFERQYKVTDNDIIVVDRIFPPQPGDEIRLEKVLLVGSANFTLIGRPFLPVDQVAVYGTMINKRLSDTKVTYFFRKRKNFRRIYFNKDEENFIRIKSIVLCGKVNDISDVDGLRDKIF